MEDGGGRHHRHHLQERGADHHVAGHPEDVDQRRHQDEAAADTEQRADEADGDAERQHRDHRDVEPRFLEPYPPRQAMEPVMLVGQFFAHHDAGAPLHDGAGRLDQHQRADEAEQDQETERDDEVELARRPQHLESRDAAERAEHAREHEVQRHVQVDLPASIVTERTRGRGRYHLAGHRGDRDRGGYA